MKDVVTYYDASGKECDQKDAWSMNIVSFDDNGTYIGSVIAGCNGLKPGEKSRKR